MFLYYRRGGVIRQVVLVGKGQALETVPLGYTKVNVDLSMEASHALDPDAVCVRVGGGVLGCAVCMGGGRSGGGVPVLCACGLGWGVCAVCVLGHCLIGTRGVLFRFCCQPQL